MSKSILSQIDVVSSGDEKVHTSQNDIKLKEAKCKNNNFSDQLLTFLDKHIESLRTINEKMSQDYLKLVTHNTKLNNIQGKSNNIPRTNLGIDIFRETCAEAMSTFSNVNKIRKSCNKMIVERNNINNSVNHIREIYMNAKICENFKFNNNENDQSLKDYSNNINFVPNPIGQNVQDIDTLELDIKIGEITSLSDLIIAMDNRMRPIIDGCLTVRNDIARRLRERLNVDQNQVNVE